MGRREERLSLHMGPSPMTPMFMGQQSTKPRRRRASGRAGPAAKILLLLIAAMGFVAGIGLGSVAAQQIAARAIAQQGGPPITPPAPAAMRRIPAPTPPSQRSSILMDLNKAFARGPVDDDPSDVDDDVDDLSDDVDPT